MNLQLDRTDGRRASTPKRAERSLSELIGELTTEMGSLLHKEVQLAKIEAAEEAKRAGRTAGMFGGTAIGGLMATILLSFALVALLDQALNTALSFTIVGALWAIGALVLFKAARKKFALINPLPTTRQTLKEDMQWARTLNS
jgi:uncharacterized membrane protein YqjE